MKNEFLIPVLLLASMPVASVARAHVPESGVTPDPGGQIVVSTGQESTSAVPDESSVPAVVDAPVTQNATATPETADESGQAAIAPVIVAEPAESEAVEQDFLAQTGEEGDDSIDLAALGIVDSSGSVGAAGSGVSLQFYGFADLGVLVPLYAKDSLWSGAYAPSYSSAAVGNLNLYFASQLGAKWRSLAEVRFHYGPFTGYADHTDSNRNVSLGGIEIERAHIDYLAHRWFNLRAGQWLTPYGIWNVDHGTPTLIAIRRPYSIGEQLFPERQTGFLAYGGDYLGPVKVGYQVGVSNGRGPRDSITDLNANKAVTARVDLGYGGKIGDLKLGGTYYRGKYTAANPPDVNFATGKSIENLTEVYDEQSFGADLQYDLKGFVLRAEFLLNERNYKDPFRAQNDSGGYVPDKTRWGAYGLIGYRIPKINLMPYALAERYTWGQGEKYIPNAVIYYFGLNWQITPSVVAKTEYIVVGFPGADPLISKAGDMSLLSGQLAWAF